LITSINLPRWNHAYTLSSALAAKIERINPIKDAIQIRGKRKQVSFSEFGSALRVMSGSLVVGQADIEIVGEGNNVLGTYKTIYLRSSKGDFLSEFVKFNIKAESSWDMISIPELLQKLVNEAPAQQSGTTATTTTAGVTSSSSSPPAATVSQSSPAPAASTSDPLVKSQSDLIPR